MKLTMLLGGMFAAALLSLPLSVVVSANETAFACDPMSSMYCADAGDVSPASVLSPADAVDMALPPPDLMVGGWITEKFDDVCLLDLRGVPASCPAGEVPGVDGKTA